MKKVFSTPHRLSSARMKIKITGDFLAASAWGCGWSVRRKKRKNVCGQGIGHRHSGSLSFLVQLTGRISFWEGGKSTYPDINRLEQRRNQQQWRRLRDSYLGRISNNRVHSTLHRPCSQFTNGNLVPTTRFHRRLLITQGSGGAASWGAFFVRCCAKMNQCYYTNLSR